MKTGNLITVQRPGKMNVWNKTIEDFKTSDIMTQVESKAVMLVLSTFKDREEESLFVLTTNGPGWLDPQDAKKCLRRR